MAERTSSDLPRPSAHTHTACTPAAHNTQHTGWQPHNGAGPHFSTHGDTTQLPHAGRDATRASGQGPQHAQHAARTHRPQHAGKHTISDMMAVHNPAAAAAPAATAAHTCGPAARGMALRGSLAHGPAGWPPPGLQLARLPRPAITYWYGVSTEPPRLSNQPPESPELPATARQVRSPQAKAEPRESHDKATERTHKPVGAHDARSCHCMRVYNAS